jgi:hypothetical protein
MLHRAARFEKPRPAGALRTANGCIGGYAQLEEERAISRQLSVTGSGN